MKLSLSLNTSNAAFEAQSGTETARILRELADKLDGGDILPGESIPLRDYNGNTVGQFKAS